VTVVIIFRERTREADDCIRNELISFVPGSQHDWFLKQHAQRPCPRRHTIPVFSYFESSQNMNLASPRVLVVTTALAILRMAGSMRSPPPVTEDVTLEAIARSHIWMGRKTIGMGPTDLHPEDFLTLREAGVSYFEDQYVAFCKSLVDIAAWDRAKTGLKDHRGNDLFEQVVDANCLWYGALKWMTPAQINVLHVGPFDGGIKQTDRHNYNLILAQDPETCRISKQQYDAAIRRIVDLKAQDRNGFVCYEKAGLDQHFKDYFGALRWDSDDWLVLDPIRLRRPSSITDDDWVDIIFKMLPTQSDLNNMAGPLTEDQMKRIISNLLSFSLLYLGSGFICPDSNIERISPFIQAKLPPAANEARSALEQLISKDFWKLRTNETLFVSLFRSVFNSDKYVQSLLIEYFSSAVWNDRDKYDDAIQLCRDLARKRPMRTSLRGKYDFEIPWQYRFYDDACLYTFPDPPQWNFFARLVRGRMCSDPTTQLPQSTGQPLVFGMFDADYPQAGIINTLKDTQKLRAFQTALMYGYKLPGYLSGLPKSSDPEYKWMPNAYPGFLHDNADSSQVDGLHYDIVKFLEKQGATPTVNIPKAMADRVKLCNVASLVALSDADLQGLKRDQVLDVLRSHIPPAVFVGTNAVSKLKGELADPANLEKLDCIYKLFTDKQDFVQHFDGTPLKSSAEGTWDLSKLPPTDPLRTPTTPPQTPTTPRTPTNPPLTPTTPPQTSTNSPRTPTNSPRTPTTPPPPPSESSSDGDKPDDGKVKDGTRNSGPQDSKEGDDSSLGAGAIAGIIIACVLGIAGAVGVVVFVVRQRRKAQIVNA
jgi:hypothetical protein